MPKLIARSTPIETDRRQLMKGLTAVRFSGSFSSVAFAQSKDEVPIDKLMASDELEELALGNKDAKVTIVEYAIMLVLVAVAVIIAGPNITEGISNLFNGVSSWISAAAAQLS